MPIELPVVISMTARPAAMLRVPLGDGSASRTQSVGDHGGRTFCRMNRKRTVSEMTAREEGSLTFISDETIWGRVRQADESIQYSGILKVE